MRKPVVLDTNVLVTAEGQPGSSRQCSERCQRKLRDLKDFGVVVLDSDWQIMKEYRNNLPGERQPGVGFRFFQWLLNSRTDPRICSWVTITSHQSRGYEEFPNHAGLTQFDWSDRKFVAVAATHPGKPPIVQATDSKWVGWQDALAECQIDVEFLCNEEIRDKYKKKSKRNE
jgi:hypothetical protein